MIFAELLVLLSISIMLILYEPLGSIFVMSFSIIVMFVLNYILKKYSQSFGYQRHIFSSLSNKNIFQGINNIKDIKILSREFLFTEKFDKSFQQSVKFRVYYDSLSVFPKSISELILIISFILLVLFLVWQDNSSTAIITAISLFLAASYRVIPSIMRLTNGYQTIQSHKKAAEKILKDINLIATVIPLDLNVDNCRNLEFKKEISLQNLSFSYSKDKPNIFSKVNMLIKKNQMVGIMGESGTGKTSLVDIIIGLHWPTDGHILIDGTKLSETNIKLWQSKIGYVSQNSGFIDDTIACNIALGLDDALIDKRKLLISIKKANLENFVNSLPLGLDTFIGERGIKISGGQKQRIAIARALYQDPEVLIFDEATSALDIENEKKIFKNIEDLKHDKTIIIISHKKSLLKNCNQILELKKGSLQSNPQISI